jgi:hypothetical protein
MTTEDRPMSALAAWLVDEAAVSAPPELPARIERLVAVHRQRPWWLATIANPDHARHRAAPPGRAALWIAVALLIVLGTLSAALVGARLLRPPTQLGIPTGVVIERGPVLGKPRAGHAAAVLADGRVAVISGDNEASVEVFDAVAGAWTSNGAISEARWGLSAAPLRDGTVLVTGGEANPSHAAHITVDAAEVWDPATGRSTVVGPMHSARKGHLSFALPDGSVVVAGGVASAAGSPAMPEVYDPARRSFSAPALVLPGPMTSAARLGGSLILFVGTGDPASGAPSGAWATIFDAASGQLTPTGAPVIALVGQTATTLPDGRVVLVGGMLPDGMTPDATVQVFDATTGTFSVVTELTMPRSGHIAVATRDGRVIVIGGRTRPVNGLPVTTGSIEVTGPEFATTRVIGDLGVDRTSDATATLLADGTILLVGGRTGGHMAPITSTDLVHPIAP